MQISWMATEREGERKICTTECMSSFIQKQEVHSNLKIKTVTRFDLSKALKPPYVVRQGHMLLQSDDWGIATRPPTPGLLPLRRMPFFTSNSGLWSTTLSFTVRILKCQIGLQAIFLAICLNIYTEPWEKYSWFSYMLSNSLNINIESWLIELVI